jgi:hypothetical protein
VRDTLGLNRWGPRLPDVGSQQVGDFQQIDAWPEDAVETHILEQRLDGGKFALADDEIAADVQENFAYTAFDATAAKTLAIDLAVTVDGRNENGLGPSFNRRVDELILAHHDAQIYDLDAQGREDTHYDLIAHCVAVGSNHA